MFKFHQNKGYDAVQSLTLETILNFSMQLEIPQHLKNYIKTVINIKNMYFEGEKSECSW